MGCNYFAFPPEKFRFSKEFIELRRQALDLFVNRIASHPELKQSGDLKIFLQADEEVNYLHAKLLLYFFFPFLIRLCIALNS